MDREPRFGVLQKVGIFRQILPAPQLQQKWRETCRH
jgi:hypothetical protein